MNEDICNVITWKDLWATGFYLCRQGRRTMPPDNELHYPTTVKMWGASQLLILDASICTISLEAVQNCGCLCASPAAVSAELLSRLTPPSPLVRYILFCYS